MSSTNVDTDKVQKVGLYATLPGYGSGQLMDFSTFFQFVFWVRIAPTMISNFGLFEETGHQPIDPNSMYKILYILRALFIIY